MKAFEYDKISFVQKSSFLKLKEKKRQLFTVREKNNFILHDLV